MENNHYPTKTDRAVNLVEKWALVVLVLVPYLFISYKIIHSLAQPSDNIRCGNGYFAAMVLHFSLALIVTIVLSLRFFISKKFPLIVVISILAIVITLPFISYSLF